MRGSWETWKSNDFFQTINRYVLIADGWVGEHLGLVLLRELGPRRAWRVMIMIFDSNVVGVGILPLFYTKLNITGSNECSKIRIQNPSPDK